MLNPLRISLLLVAMLCAVPVAQPQEPPQTTKPEQEFVSGTIADLPPGKIVVNRAVLGKPAENLTFTITPETKIEGQLRVKARVTVGYTTTETGESIAVRIIVREQK